MYAPCWSSTESAALTPMIAQRRTPHNENAMFYVASAPYHSVTTINEPRRSRPAQCACIEGIRRSNAICESAREPKARANRASASSSPKSAKTLPEPPRTPGCSSQPSSLSYLSVPCARKFSPCCPSYVRLLHADVEIETFRPQCPSHGRRTHS
jgi:hypothetical protein